LSNPKRFDIAGYCDVYEHDKGKYCLYTYCEALEQELAKLKHEDEIWAADYTKLKQQNKRYKTAHSDENINRISEEYFNSIVDILAYDLQISKHKITRCINKHYFTNAIREALKEPTNGN